MADKTQSAGRMMGHDAMHRARILHTHPTHACSEQFRQSSGALLAGSPSGIAGNGANTPIRERASGTPGKSPC